MHSREASRTSVKLDVSGGVASRAYSSAFAGMSIMNRKSLSLCLYVVVAAVLSGGKVGTPRRADRGEGSVRRPYRDP